MTIIASKRLWFKKAQFFFEAALPPQETLEQYDFVEIFSLQKLDLLGWREIEKPTTVIDLSVSEEEIFKSFNDTTRNEIRRTIDNPDFSFHVGTDHDIYPLYERFEKAYGRKPRGEEEMKSFTACEALYKGGIVAGLYVIESFPYLRIRSIFSKRLNEPDKEMIKIVSNAGRALMWQVCLYGKSKGFNKLDLAFINVTDPSKKGITDFKMSFGGVTVPEYIYIYKSKLFRFFERFA